MRMTFAKWRPAWLLPMLCVIVALGAGIVQPMAQPPKAQAAQKDIPGLPGLPSPCDAIPDSTAQKICKGVTDPIGTIPGIPGIPDIPGAIAGSAVDAAVGRMAQIFGGYLVNNLLVGFEKYITTGTSANLHANWFVHLFDTFYWYADGLAILALFIALAIDLKRVDLGGMAYTLARFAIFVAFIASLPELVNALQLIMHREVTPQIFALANQQGNDLFKSVITKANNDLGASGSIYTLAGLLLTVFIGAIFGLILKIMLDLVALGIVLYTLLAALTFGLFVFGRGGQRLFIKNLMILGALIAFQPIMALVFVVTLSIANQPNPGLDTITQVVAMMIAIVAAPVAVYRWASNHQIDAVGPINRGASRAGNAAKTAYVAKKATVVATAL